MDAIKMYIIRIIIVSAIIQLGFVMTPGKYKKLFSFLGGVFLVCALFTLPKTDFTDIFNDYNNVISYEEYDEDISNFFTDDVESKVEQTIKEVFGEEVTATVSTDEDYSHIKIEVDLQTDSDMCDKIRQHITQIFCTDADEVIMYNEVTY